MSPIKIWSSLKGRRSNGSGTFSKSAIAGVVVCQGCIFLVCTASSCPVASTAVFLAMHHHTGAFFPLDIYCLELMLLPKVVKPKTERKGSVFKKKKIRMSVAIADLKRTVNQFNIITIYTIFTQQEDINSTQDFF